MRRLAIFARRPVAGVVRTRLSPALPAAMATRLHAAVVADALHAARACGADERSLWWASDAPAEVRVETRDFAEAVQRAGDPGARLARAFDELLAVPGARAVIVSADCPALEANHLDAAFEALGGSDAVIGASEDGGCWLLGLSRPVPELFRDVPWESGGAGALLLSRAVSLRLRVAQLPALAVLETPADLARLTGACACDRVACGPATRDALRAFGLLP